MIEIFTNSREGDGGASRTVGTEVVLTGASDVYFSSITPGIAFYEKSGTNLIVTLMDGREVTIKRFFIVEPSGNFSRLLKEANGEEEVTGLLAPEPVSAVPRLEETEASEEAIPEDMPVTEARSSEADQAVVSADTGETNAATPGASPPGDDDADQGVRIAPSTLDKIFVGSAGIGTLALMSDNVSGSGDNREAPPLNPQAPPRTEVQGDQAEPTGAGDPVESTDPSDPVESANPSGPVESANSSGPVESANPDNPNDPTIPGGLDAQQAGILAPIINEDGLLGGLSGAIESLLGRDNLLGNLIGDDTATSDLTGAEGVAGNLSDNNLLQASTDEAAATFSGLFDSLLGETDSVSGLLVGDGDPLSSLLDNDDLFGGNLV
ncbi:hypothetical protein ACLGGT_20965 [Roseovarius sp. MS2]|uniref:hypothetical protein n=1 Tax=Roseovarius sp. MS2 TaxID=3390728 RepID=UPI003EDBA040